MASTKDCLRAVFYSYAKSFGEGTVGRRITPIHHRKLRKIFELDGWEFVRQKGSHIELQKEGAERPVVIPRYKDITVRIIESNMRTAGMSHERYFELLDKV